jgi:hypothetical protein
MSALVGEIELRPDNGFELSLRGYHRAQVDRYVATLQMRLTTLETELASSRYREQQLAGRVDRLATELEECGQNGSRMIGSRIQKIIELAEEESQALREQAKGALDEAQADAEQLLADARRQAEEAMRDFQNALAQRRSEEARAEAARRMQWEARRQQQREAAEEVLTNARAVSADGLTLTRRLLDALAGQHATLAEEVRSVEKALANLSG